MTADTPRTEPTESAHPETEPSRLGPSRPTESTPRAADQREHAGTPVPARADQGIRAVSADRDPDSVDSDRVGTEPEGTKVDSVLIAVVVTVTAGLLLLAFYGSFQAVSELSAGKVDPPWLPPLVIDGCLVAFIGLDLALTRKRAPSVMLRHSVRGFTGLTLVANAMSGWPDLISVVLHIPAALAIVIITESARRYFMRKNARFAGLDYDPIPIARWLLAPVSSFFLWRRMMLWGQRSYPKALATEIDRRDLIDRCKALGDDWKKRIPASVWWQIRQGVRLQEMSVRVAALTADSARTQTTVTPEPSPSRARTELAWTESAPELTESASRAESESGRGAESTHPEPPEPRTESSRADDAAESPEPPEPTRSESTESETEPSRDPDPEPTPPGPRGGGGAPAPRTESAAPARLGTEPTEPTPEPSRADMAPVLARAAALLCEPTEPETRRHRLRRALFRHSGRTRGVLADLRAEAGDPKLKAPTDLYSVRDTWHTDVARALMDDTAGDAERVLADLEAAGVEIRPEITAEIQRWQSEHGVRVLRPVGE